MHSGRFSSSPTACRPASMSERPQVRCLKVQGRKKHKAKDSYCTPFITSLRLDSTLLEIQESYSGMKILMRSCLFFNVQNSGTFVRSSILKQTSFDKQTKAQSNVFFVAVVVIHHVFQGCSWQWFHCWFFCCWVSEMWIDKDTITQSPKVETCLHKKVNLF